MAMSFEKSGNAAARLALRGLLQVGGELNIRSDHYVMWHNVATSPAQVKTFNSDRYEK
jgi:hypothetical protein